MFGFSVKRLAATVSVALASVGATGGMSTALLNNGGNFSVVVPVTAVVPVGVCSAQSVSTSNNANHGDEFERNDAKSWSDSESRCDVANNIARNVEDVLNGNIRDNNNNNGSHNLNRSLDHNNNGNIRDIGERGSLIEL
jgi:hypothetical protein